MASNVGLGVLGGISGFLAALEKYAEIRRREQLDLMQLQQKSGLYDLEPAQAGELRRAPLLQRILGQTYQSIGGQPVIPYGSQGGALTLRPAPRASELPPELLARFGMDKPEFQKTLRRMPASKITGPAIEATMLDTRNKAVERRAALTARRQEQTRLLARLNDLTPDTVEQQRQVAAAKIAVRNVDIEDDAAWDRIATAAEQVISPVMVPAYGYGPATPVTPGTAPQPLATTPPAATGPKPPEVAPGFGPYAVPTPEPGQVTQLPSGVTVTQPGQEGPRSTRSTTGLPTPPTAVPPVPQAEQRALAGDTPLQTRAERDKAKKEAENQRRLDEREQRQAAAQQRTADRQTARDTKADADEWNKNRNKVLDDIRTSGAEPDVIADLTRRTRKLTQGDTDGLADVIAAIPPKPGYEVTLPDGTVVRNLTGKQKADVERDAQKAKDAQKKQLDTAKERALREISRTGTPAQVRQAQEAVTNAQDMDDVLAAYAAAPQNQFVVGKDTQGNDVYGNKSDRIRSILQASPPVPADMDQELATMGKVAIQGQPNSATPEDFDIAATRIRDRKFGNLVKYADALEAAKADAPMQDRERAQYWHPKTLQNPLPGVRPSEAHAGEYKLLSPKSQETVTNMIEARDLVKNMKKLALGGVDETGSYTGTKGAYYPGIFDPTLDTGVFNRLRATARNRMDALAQNVPGQNALRYERFKRAFLSIFSKSVGREGSHISDMDNRNILNAFAIALPDGIFGMADVRPLAEKMFADLETVIDGVVDAAFRQNIIEPTPTTPAPQGGIEGLKIFQKRP